MRIKPEVIFILVCTLIIAGCNGDDGAVPTTGTPFLGGTEGITMSFVEEAPPDQVFAGGDFPFDVAVRVENKGEFLIERDKMSVSITGINPSEFGVGAGGLIKSPDEDILPTRKDPQGNVIQGTPTFVEFIGLNRQAPISGSSLTYKIRADVCYEYGTLAVSQICMRKNILNPQAGGLCNINEQKEVFNSGGPVQIENLKEFARSSSSIGFSFDITHRGVGAIFEPGSVCEKARRSAENRVWVDVRPAPGATADIRCTGLPEGGSQGFTTLYGTQQKTITCTVNVGTPGDYFLPIEVETRYDYEQTAERNLIVKASGG